MSSRRPRHSRQRGATYTVFVVIFSIVILAGASTYVTNSRQSVQRSGFELRTSRLREAAFAGVMWAARAADQGQAEGRCTLAPEGSSVEVSFRRVTTAEGQHLVVTSTASGPERALVCEATLRSVADRFRLETFTITTRAAR